jgi:hypothetical protein
MLDADELAYLDQLYENATELDDQDARDKFIQVVFDRWPQISAALDEHKHSL